MSEDPSLLDRYLAGECTPAEEAELRRRFGDADPREAIRSALRDQDAASRFDSTRAWTDIRPQLHVQKRLTGRWSRGGLVRIAAAIVFIVTGAVAVPPLIIRQLQRQGSPAGGTVVASTGIGERRDVRLSDGTLVMLAPKSELRYPAQFGSGARSVSLRGEAAFSVAHDVTRPFTVSASGLSVRVLGTEFVVRENGAEGTTDVVVASGRVWLQTPTDSTSPILTARQLGHVNVASGRILVSKDVAVDRYMSWRTGHVRVEKSPLRGVLPELTRWFDVDFVLADSALASRTLSADLRVGNGASLDVVLSAITLAVDARYTREGRTVTLRRR